MTSLGNKAKVINKNYVMLFHLYFFNVKPYSPFYFTYNLNKQFLYD